MKPVCEVVVQILPSIRAMIAKKLIEDYGLSQKQAALRLGISQPAISQYKRELRGSKAEIFKNNPSLLSLVEKLTLKTARGELSQEGLTLEFCDICRELRRHGIACEMHKKLHPGLESCKICLED